MAPPNTKPLALLIVVIGALIAISLVFSPRTNLANKYLFTQSQTSEEQAPQQPNQSFANTETKHIKQEKVIKQRVIEDFENAFLKQYTAPVGCEGWENDSDIARCTNHQLKAKQAFKQDYIKTRGLPKNTFDYQKFSFRD